MKKESFKNSIIIAMLAMIMILLVVIIIMMATKRNNGETPSESSEPTTTVTVPTTEPTEEPELTPTSELTPTDTPEPTTEPTPTAEPTAEPTEAPTPTKEPLPTATPTAEPTAIPTAEPTPTATPAIITPEEYLENEIEINFKPLLKGWVYLEEESTIKERNGGYKFSVSFRNEEYLITMNWVSEGKSGDENIIFSYVSIFKIEVEDNGNYSCTEEIFMGTGDFNGVAEVLQMIE